jgi:hypothetical protein
MLYNLASETNKDVIAKAPLPELNHEIQRCLYGYENGGTSQGRKSFFERLVWLERKYARPVIACQQSAEGLAANALRGFSHSRCHPEGNELEFLALASTSCLRDIESFGQEARGAGPKLIPFLDSPNADDRLGAVTTLGVIGYSEAIPNLRAALKDLDWRVVYAAVKSLGELRAVEATADLQQIYDTYWLPEVRRQARYSLTNLKLPADAPTPYDQLEADRKSGGFPYDLYYAVLDDIPECSSQQ